MTDQVSGARDRGNPTTLPVPEMVSFDEASARYRGEWILLQVTEYDADHWPSRGRLLAHSPEREEISTALALQPPRAELPPCPIWRAGA